MLRGQRSSILRVLPLESRLSRFARNKPPREAVGSDRSQLERGRALTIERADGCRRRS